MNEGEDLVGKQIGRDDFLRLAAVAGGAAFLGGPAAVAEAARIELAKESGRLQVMDWAGYGNDGGQAMFAAYVKAHPRKRKKHLVRLIWSSETNLWEAFGSGELWIAYAWPNEWVQMKKKKLKVVYMRPKEKPVAWVGMLMLLKGTPRYRLAHAYVDAWSSAKSAKWLEDNYGYGHANTLARPSSSDLLKALKITNPKAVTEPNAHLDRDIPRRAVYARMWEEVKAS